MNRFMKSGVALAALALAGCQSTPANDALLHDAQIGLAAMSAIEASVKQWPGVPASDVVLVDATLSIMQNAIGDLQSGTRTPAGFVDLFSAQIRSISPVVLKDMNANADITLGVNLLTNLIPVLVADVTSSQPVGPKTSLATAKLAGWVAVHH